MLKPGGRIAIFDLLHTSRYAEVLQGAGMKVQDLGHDLLWFLPGRSLLAQKPNRQSLKAPVSDLRRGHVGVSFLVRTATRIINEVKGVNRAVCEMTSTPQGTIERAVTAPA